MEPRSRNATHGFSLLTLRSCRNSCSVMCESRSHGAGRWPALSEGLISIHNSNTKRKAFEPVATVQRGSLGQPHAAVLINADSLTASRMIPHSICWDRAWAVMRLREHRCSRLSCEYLYVFLIVWHRPDEVVRGIEWIWTWLVEEKPLEKSRYLLLATVWINDAGSNAISANPSEIDCVSPTPAASPLLSRM